MKKKVAIIGGGPASLLLASFLNPKLFSTTIYEKNKTLGRKFLVAGKGGFNLSHSENIEEFIKRYTPSSFLEQALLNFSNIDLRQWLDAIGIPTFIGSSNRIYPTKNIKPIQVLNAITSILTDNNVVIKGEFNWSGWNQDNHLLFNESQSIDSDIVVFALGGGSWKVTGSDEAWLNHFSEKDINTLNFQPSNCAYQIEWNNSFITKNEGSPLKNIQISCNQNTQKGEVVITKFGIEGNAIYALSNQVQKQLQDHNKAEIFIDFKPTLSLAEITNRLTTSTERKISDTLRKKLKLSQTQVNLLKDQISKDDFFNPLFLSKMIKQFPLVLTNSAPLDEAISTTGGIALDEVNSNFELHKLKNTFCIGEMLDWNAPTGGYLLQACFSMGVHLAKHLNKMYS